MKRKRLPHHPFRSGPRYPHHVEACIRAGGAAARALLLLIKVLEDEQTPARRKCHRRVRRAKEMLEKSTRWTTAAQRKPTDSE